VLLSCCVGTTKRRLVMKIKGAFLSLVIALAGLTLVEASNARTPSGRQR